MEKQIIFPTGFGKTSNSCWCFFIYTFFLPLVIFLSNKVCYFILDSPPPNDKTFFVKCSQSITNTFLWNELQIFPVNFFFHPKTPLNALSTFNFMTWLIKKQIKSRNPFFPTMFTLNHTNLRYPWPFPHCSFRLMCMFYQHQIFRRKLLDQQLFFASRHDIFIFSCFFKFRLQKETKKDFISV